MRSLPTASTSCGLPAPLQAASTSRDRDVRAPLTVAEALQAGISGSKLVVLPNAGHLCNIEAPDGFNAAVRDFLHESRS